MSLTVDFRHRLGDFPLVADFDVPGGLSVVFGPSGAGKSQTLRLIAGLERPAAGRIVLAGEPLTDTAKGVWLAARERRVGMVFQQPLLLPHRSVLRNVTLAARDRNRSERRRTAWVWLERVGAADLASRRPAQLSGGQQQRVALARALAGQPRLLLFDEPFGALDLPVRRQLRALVRDLVQRAQVPTLFVTHDQEELASLAEQVVLAEAGSLTRVVGPAEALATVQEASAAAYTG